MKKIAKNTRYFSKAPWQKDVIMFLNAGGNGPVPSFQSINIQYSATAHYSELFIRFFWEENTFKRQAFFVRFLCLGEFNIEGIFQL